MRKKRFIRKTMVEPESKLPGDSSIAADEIERTRYDIMLARLESLRHGSRGRGAVEADGDEAVEEDEAMVSESSGAFLSSTFADSTEAGGGLVDDIVDDEGTRVDVEADVVVSAASGGAGSATEDQGGDLNVEVDVSGDVAAAGNEAGVEGVIAGGDGGVFREKTPGRFVVNQQLLNAESADVVLMQDIIVEIVLSDINGHLKRQPS